MVASLVYSLFRILVDVMVTSRSEKAELQAEVLALRKASPSFCARRLIDSIDR